MVAHLRRLELAGAPLANTAARVLANDSRVDRLCQVRLEGIIDPETVAQVTHLRAPRLTSLPWWA